MPDSLATLQDRFIADLLAHNDAAAFQMVKAYAPIYDALTARWQAALTELLRAEEDSVPAGQLNFLRLQTERLQTLRRQTAAQITRFSADAERSTQAQQTFAVGIGQAHAATLTQAALSQSAAGFSASFTQLPSGALEDLVGAFADGSPLRTLFQTFGPEAADSAQDVLFRALATGLSPRLAATQLSNQLGVPLTRALATSRTEMMRSYRESNRRAYQQNDDVVKAWRWSAQLGPRTCSACWAQHGTVHPLTERMSSHTNCRCSAVPITRTWAELGFPPAVSDLAPPSPSNQRPGIELFARQSDEVQLRVLGPGKLALYKSGAIDLEDTVALTFHPRWGQGTQEASISQALANHGGAKSWLVLDEPSVPAFSLPARSTQSVVERDAPVRLRHAVQAALAVR